MTMPPLPNELWLLWVEPHDDLDGHWLITDDCNPGFDDPLLAFESEAAALAGVVYQKDKCDLHELTMIPVCIRRTDNSCRAARPPSL